MRLRMLPVALAILFGITACESGVKATRSNAGATPTAVSCADAPGLRQRAVDDRRHAEAAKSVQEKVSTGNRASYLATLAIIADLKCKVTLTEVDAALKRAFDAARKAEKTSSFYERAQRWSEADFLAKEALAVLVRQLPARLQVVRGILNYEVQKALNLATRDWQQGVTPSAAQRRLASRRSVSAGRCDYLS